MVLRFKQEKVTKNTVKFAEVPENDLDTVKVGVLYVQKAALKDLGWHDDGQLVVELKVGA